MVFIGRNGQGKTNIVEAVGYLATHSSHRVATDAPMIRLGASQALITGEVVTDERRVLIELALLQGRANRARINGVPVTRFREALGYARVVVFAPEDLSIVKGDPAERRRFLDELVIQQKPRLSAIYTDYEQTLKQRNALLKSGLQNRYTTPGDFDATLAVWDEQLIALGAQIVVARLAIIEALRSIVTSIYATLAQGASQVDVGMTYRSTAQQDDHDDRDASEAHDARDGEPSSVTQSTPPPNAGSTSTDKTSIDKGLTDSETHWRILLTQALARVRAQERARGLTVIGPHRDDLVLTLGPHPVKGFASQGESWSLALALRLASISLLSALGEAPIVVLDDVFAELDSGRRSMLRDYLRGVDQVFITAAVEEDLPEGLDATKFDVRDGAIMQRSA